MFKLFAGIQRIPVGRWQVGTFVFCDRDQLFVQLRLFVPLCEQGSTLVQRAQQFAVVGEPMAPGHDLAEHAIALADALLQQPTVIGIHNQVEQANTQWCDGYHPFAASRKTVLGELVGDKRLPVLLQHSRHTIKIIAHLLLRLGRTLTARQRQ